MPRAIVVFVLSFLSGAALAAQNAPPERKVVGNVVTSERDPAVRQKSLDAMRRIGADPKLARDYMLKASMIGSVRHAAEIR